MNELPAKDHLFYLSFVLPKLDYFAKTQRSKLNSAMVVWLGHEWGDSGLDSICAN